MAASEAQGVIPLFVPRRVVFDLNFSGKIIPHTKTRVLLFIYSPNKSKHRKDNINTMTLGDMGEL